MQVAMVKIHIVGHRQRLDDVLEELYELGTVHLIDVTRDRTVRLPPLALDEDHVRQIEELRFLRARLDAVLALSSRPAPELPWEEADPQEARAELQAAADEIEGLSQQRDALRAESDTLPQYLASLRTLLPLVPELTTLQGYETMALLVDARHAAILGDVAAAMNELVGANFTILSDQVDPDTIGAVLVFPKRESRRVQDLLGREQVTRVRLPTRFEGIPFQQAITAMEHRLAEIPVELANTQTALDQLIADHPHWPAARKTVDGRIQQLEAVSHLGATAHTFVLSGWVPRREVDQLETSLDEALEGEAIIEIHEPLPGESPPVLLDNPAVAQPFEFLVKLLALPRYGSLDPTLLMMIFLPVFFGMMLGDVAYGLILLTAALLVRRRFRDRSKLATDLSNVFVLSAAWATAWGIVYGEFFGDLGRRMFGWEPIWIDREEALEPLLLFALAIGASHVVLGLALGTWEAIRHNDRRQLTQRIAMLVALMGLFLIVGVAADQLPAGFTSPGVAALVVGLVLLIAAEGALGVVTAPLELIGTVGNVLSYLRIGAIGLASVYLARVANELGATGPLWLGVVVAALFHALNVALGAFSPTIQSLRLHYVEFFGKFYEEGGRDYAPFGRSQTSAPGPSH